MTHNKVHSLYLLLLLVYLFLPVCQSSEARRKRVGSMLMIDNPYFAPTTGKNNNAMQKSDYTIIPIPKPSHPIGHRPTFMSEQTRMLATFLEDNHYTDPLPAPLTETDYTKLGNLTDCIYTEEAIEDTFNILNYFISRVPGNIHLAEIYIAGLAAALKFKCSKKKELIRSYAQTLITYLTPFFTATKEIDETLDNAMSILLLELCNTHIGNEVLINLIDTYKNNVDPELDSYKLADHYLKLKSCKYRMCCYCRRIGEFIKSIFSEDIEEAGIIEIEDGPP